MLIPMDDAKKTALIRALDTNEDAQALGGGGYTVDLYDREAPASLELEAAKDGVDVLAVRRLLYSDAMDGWYLGEEVEDAGELAALLDELIK